MKSIKTIMVVASLSAMLAGQTVFADTAADTTAPKKRPVNEAQYPANEKNINDGAKTMPGYVIDQNEADKNKSKYDVVPGKIYLIVNKNPITVDADPFIEPASQRTMVPIRFVAENLGAKVDWNDQTQEVTITRGSKTIWLKIGSLNAKVDGKDVTTDVAPQIVTTDVAPQIVSGRTFVPVRFISESFGADVKWDDAYGVKAKAVFITLAQ